MKEKQAEQEAAEAKAAEQETAEAAEAEKAEDAKMRRKPLSLRLTRRMPKSKSCKIVC